MLRIKKWKKIKIFKIKSRPIKIILTIGIITFLFGLTLLIVSFYNGFKTEPLGSNMIHIIFLSQGALLVFFGYQNLKNDKYFIEWNDSEIRYLMPKNKSIETIYLKEIEKIEIELFEIRIMLPSEEKVINLESTGFKELNRIKEKLEEIKCRVKEN